MKGVVEPFVTGGEEAAREWLRTEGKRIIRASSMKSFEETATSWYEAVEVTE